VGRKLDGLNTAKLSVFKLALVPILTNGYESCVMNKRVLFQVQEAFWDFCKDFTVCHFATKCTDVKIVKPWMSRCSPNRETQLRWKVHVTRMSQERSARCCVRKSRAAYAQIFALWQQATIEFTCHDHSSRTLVIMFSGSHGNIDRAYTPRSLYYCLFAPHICMVLFFTDIPFVVNHTINATPPERLQQREVLLATHTAAV